MSIKICVKCGEEFTLFKGKPGFINDCADCGRDSERGMEKLGGSMIYSHKTCAEIQITSLSSAQNFAKISSRSGKKSNLGKSSRGTENWS